MITGIAHTSLIVREYDEAIQFYRDNLGFKVVEDTELPNKRWVRLQAPGRQGSEILLSKAVDDKQRAAIGNQTGGRVLFFVHTDNFDHDYALFKSRGVEFLEGPFDQKYGKVAVFKDLYGNRIDLIEPKPPQQPINQRVFSGAPWEKQVGYCRVVRHGSHIVVSGTAPAGDGGGGNVHAVGDPYEQTKRCIQIIQRSLMEVGANLSHVVRTRMFVTDITRWEAYGKAHREYFGDHPPATSMVEVKSLIDPQMMIEVEADAII